MRGHSLTKIDDRVRALEDLRQELQGRSPRGPFEFSDNLEFDGIKVEDDDPPLVVRFKASLKRDLRHATAGPVYLQLFGYSQNMRSIYDGGRQLIDGGAE